MAGNIKGITIEFRGDTTKLDKALRQINSETKSLDKELKLVDKALKFNPKSVDLWKQKQQILTEKISESKEKLKLLKEAQAKMDASGVDKNSAEYRNLQREIIETESKVKNFEKQLRKVGNAKLTALGEQFKQIGAKMTEAGKSLTTKVTAPLAAVGAVAAKKFAEVDKTMQLTNSTMGNTAEEAQLLNKAMKEAAASSTYGMSDAATATLNFARAGLSAEQAASALAPAMALAAGEGGELDTVSAGLVATINGFHGSFDQASQYADVFANACNNSALDVNSLSSAMSVAAPIFSAAGYSVKDAALYMGVMANNGIDADKAANSLKTGIARLVSPSAEAAAMMDKLGISVTNSDGTMKDSVQIQSELNAAFSQLSESEQIAAASAIFGKNQMAPWLALINTAPDDVNKLANSLDNAAGTTDEMSEAMMSGFGGSLEKLKASVDVLATSFGEALAPTIQRVADFIQGLVDKFNSLTPAQQQTIAQIGLFLAALGPVIAIVGGIISVIGTVVGAIGTIITAVTAAAGVLSAGGTAAGALAAAIAALGGPVTVVVGIIVGLIAVGGLLIANWDTVKAAAASIWESIKTTIVNVMTSIKTTLTTVWEAIKTAITTVLNTIKTTITTVFNAVKTTVTTIWNAIKTAITTVVNAIQTVITTVWNAIKTTVTTVVSAIQTTITTVWNAIKSTITSVLDAIKSTITEAWNTAKSTVTSVVDGIKSTVTSGFNAAKNTVTSVMDGIKSTITNAWDAAKSTVTNVINGIKTAISSGLNAAKSTVTNIFTAIKDKIQSVMDAAKNAVANAISAIRSKFNFHWSLPKLKLPHISINGKFSLNPPSVPHFSISWHKNAMENGLIFTNPTIFGMMGGKLQGAGDAGAEALIGVNSLTRKIQAAVASVGTNDPDVIYAAVKAGMENANVGIYIGEREFGRMLKGQGVVFA